jgi:hypothetical protein
LVAYTYLRENITNLCKNYYQIGNDNTDMVINITKLGRDNQIGFLDELQGDVVGDGGTIGLQMSFASGNERD